MQNKINEIPLVSFCLLTYNQEAYIEEALNALFLQNYPSLEIIISDDFSNDKTREKITRIVGNYNGEHTIRLNFNSQNQGLASNFNNAVSLAQGEFILVGAGDDISMPDRTIKSVNFMLDHPECYLADYHVDYIDEKGKITRSKEKNEDISFDIEDLFNGSVRGFRGCSRVYRKKMFEIFGPLNLDCPTEDSTSVWRGLILGKIWVLKDKKVLYRKHQSSISSPSNMFKLSISNIIKQYIKDINTAYSMNLLNEVEYKNMLNTAGNEKRKRQQQRFNKMIRNTIKTWRNNLLNFKNE